MDDKQAEAQGKTHKLIKAYKAVFGVSGSRTEAQEIVYKDLMERWRVERPVFIPNIHTLYSSDEMKNETVYDPIKAAITEGCRLPVIQIKEFVETTIDDKVKPKTKR